MPNPDVRPATSFADHERIESDYWRRSTASSQDLHSLDSLSNTLNKLMDAGVFLHALLPHLNTFARASFILEIGAGQGWASCMVKRLCPRASVIATDISPVALSGIRQWAHVFQADVDQVVASRSYEIPLRDQTMDCVFCFASAHHFRAHRDTLAEIHRVLASGGSCFYFHEPSSPRFWHKAAVARVNRKRPEVPEDVLVPAQLRALATEVGLECQALFDPSLYKRAPMETVYYGLLRAVPTLQRVLPCTMTYRFTK